MKNISSERIEAHLKASKKESDRLALEVSYEFEAQTPWTILANGAALKAEAEMLRRKIAETPEGGWALYHRAEAEKQISSGQIYAYRDGTTDDYVQKRDYANEV